MPDKKHFVFSARTTEEGLKLLNDLRKEKDIGWDELVIEAVCTYYELDRAVMALLKQDKPKKPHSKDRTTNSAKGKKKGESDGKDKRQIGDQRAQV